jgi:hypothetical protein
MEKRVTAHSIILGLVGRSYSLHFSFLVPSEKGKEVSKKVSSPAGT